MGLSVSGDLRDLNESWENYSYKKLYQKLFCFVFPIGLDFLNNQF